MRIPDEVRNWLVLCHLAGFAALIPPLPVIGALLGPLVVWLFKRRIHPAMDEYGREAVNFQITALIYFAVATVLIPLIVGIPLIIGVFLFWMISMIRAAVRASEGKGYYYSYTIRFLT